MNKKFVCAVAIAAAFPAYAANAQTAAVLGTTQSSELRAGMEIPMKTRVDLTTKGKALRVGQRVELEVAQDVTFGGQTVIPAGTPAMGELTTVRNKGSWGKSGSIEARVLYLRVGDRQIRCSGVFSDKGVTGTAGVVAAVAFIPIAGFLTTGTSARIPLGAPVKAFLDEDVPVAFAAQAPTPLTVAAGAAVSAPAANPVSPIASAATLTSATSKPATLQPAVITKN